MIQEITALSDPRLAIFASLTEAQLRNRLDPSRGIFIAESPKVIRVALQAGYEPQALLCERKHITGDAADIIANCSDIPIYTGARELLAQLTGYTLTRGVLCAMHRRPEPPVAEVIGKAEYRCHLPFCSGLRHRCRPTHAECLRPLEPSGCTRLHGECVPGALDLAR